MADHTETLEVDFDPEKLSFDELLDLFWKSHNPFAARRSRQYMSALFWRNDEQRRAVEAGVARLEEGRDAKVTTALESFDAFYLAEDYHQKYFLRRHTEFEKVLLEIYPNLIEFTNSTAAARLNSYLAGQGSREDLARDLPLLGLSKEARERFLGICR